MRKTKPKVTEENLIKDSSLYKGKPEDIEESLLVVSNSYQRGRKLSYSAVKAMEGMPVLVRDLTMDIYDQLCIVKYEYKPWYVNGKHGLAISKVILTNGEFSYSYSPGGNCENGGFECYAPVKEKE